jgi:glycosyltransferase involved in cell wall biosynthesis
LTADALVHRGGTAIPLRGGERPRPLRIAMLAPPWIPVPPPAYGGVEAVVALLADALVARGHDVVLFCSAGSACAAHVRTLSDCPRPERMLRAQYECDHVACAFAEIDAAAGSAPFDVVHDHCGHTALAMADRLATPLVHTVHLPFEGDAGGFYARHGAKGTLVCLSHSQARRAPVGVRVDAVVPNPMDLAGWPQGPRERRHLLWMGRLVPDKGPHRAIAVARAAGRPLILAGPKRPGFERFFAAEIEPHLDGERCRYVGEVGGAEKHRLFAEASALLMPISWPEPFGMVMVEALAAGTPVIACACGAAPEIVDHGLTGFLVEDEDEMVAAVAAATRLDPTACRRAVARRWASDTVAAAYEAVYLRVARARAVAAA